MSEPKLAVPFLDSYWVVPGKLLAGEYPGSYNPSHLVARVSAVLDTGIQTFIDLTEERELEPYYSILRVLGHDRKIDVAYARMPIRDQTKFPIKIHVGHHS